MAGLFKPLHCPSNLYCADSIKEKGPPRRWDGPFLNYGGGSVRISTLGIPQPRAALAAILPSCPDTLLQYLMMHWITSFQMFRLIGGSHRFGIFQVKIYLISSLCGGLHDTPNNQAERKKRKQRNRQLHAPIRHSKRDPQRHHWPVRHKGCSILCPHDILGGRRT